MRKDTHRQVLTIDIELISTNIIDGGPTGVNFPCILNMHLAKQSARSRRSDLDAGTNGRRNSSVSLPGEYKILSYIAVESLTVKLGKALP